MSTNYIKNFFRLSAVLVLFVLGQRIAHAQSLSTYIGITESGGSYHTECDNYSHWEWSDELDNWVWVEDIDCYPVLDYYWYNAIFQVYGSTSGCAMQVVVTLSDSSQLTYNFTATGGTQSQSYYYTSNDAYPVSATATQNCYLTVSGDSPIKTGVSGASADAILTIGGSADMNDISVASSNSGRFTVTESARDSTNRLIYVHITGVAATSTSFPAGDAVIQGRVKSATVCEGPSIIVVTPTTRTHSVGASTLQNTYTTGTLKSETHLWVTMTIKDQFGNTLPNIFAGAQKVDERFDNQSGSSSLAFVTTRTTMTLPDDWLYSTGVKFDEVGYSISYGRTLNSSDQSAFQAGTLLLTGILGGAQTSGYNLIQTYFGDGNSVSRSGDMVLWVWDIQLTDAPNRNMTITGNHPATTSTTN